MISAASGRTVYTIGHSTRTLAEFVGLLREFDVSLIADVRAIPRSRHNPQFNIDELPQSLSRSEIDYEHIAELGGRRHRPADAPPSPNSFWHNDSFRNYADYAMTEPFRIGMARLRITLDRCTCAVMCSEALWWRCHRRLISDYLLAEGFEVIHILGNHQSARAVLTAGVNERLDGTLVYSGQRA